MALDPHESNTVAVPCSDYGESRALMARAVSWSYIALLLRREPYDLAAT